MCRSKPPPLVSSVKRSTPHTKQVFSMSCFFARWSARSSPARYRGDIWEIYGRYRGDIGEVVRAQLAEGVDDDAEDDVEQDRDDNRPEGELVRDLLRDRARHRDRVRARVRSRDRDRIRGRDRVMAREPWPYP